MGSGFDPLAAHQGGNPGTKSPDRRRRITHPSATRPRRAPSASCPGSTPLAAAAPPHPVNRHDRFPANNSRHCRCRYQCRYGAPRRTTAVTPTIFSVSASLRLAQLWVSWIEWWTLRTTLFDINMSGFPRPMGGACVATATANQADAAEQPAQTEQGPLSRGRLITIFIGLIMGILMAALDQTIVATAMPTIADDLNGLQSFSWIFTTYLLGQTIAMPLYGKVGDIIGRKLAFHVAIVIFPAGSVIAGVAQSMGMLIASRAVQGIGAGGLMIGAQTIMAAIVTARERGKYMSIMGPMIGVATVLGPLLGGYLTQHVSWRWIFYINVPIGAAALIITAVALSLPKVQHKVSIDYWGILLMAGTVTCLVLLLNWGGTKYDWLSPTILGLAGGVIVLLPLWLFVESRAKEPLLPLRLFRDGVFRINVPLAFMIGIAMFGAVSYLPTYLQLSLNATATKSGLLMLPLMGGLMFAA